MSFFRTASFIFLAMVTAASARADERWNCSFDAHNGVPGLMSATMRINENDLQWQPYGGMAPNGRLLGTSFSFKVLRNDAIGVVAANYKPIDWRKEDLGVGVEVIVFSKPNGILRVGHVSTSGDPSLPQMNWQGNCKRQ